MDFEVLQENLNYATSLATRILSSKTTLPILSYLFLEAKDNSLILIVTNLENSLRIKIPAKIKTEGKICLPAKTFQEIISNLPSSKITFKKEENKLNLICAQTKIQINTFSTEEFPQIPSPQDKNKVFEFEKEKFLAIAEEVAFCVSNDESRPVLNGILFKKENKELVVVGTDGYRLSKKIFKGDFEKIEEMIIPAKSILEISRMMPKDEKKIKLILDKKQNQVIFVLGEIQLISRLIDGNFPDYQKIIPQVNQTKAIFEKEDFKRALKIASVFAKESANIIKLKIETLKKKITLSAQASQVGENETEIDAKIEGEGLEIAFNYHFLQEVFNALKTEEIELNLNGSLSPAVFQIPNQPDFFHLIMPIRLQTSE